MSDLTSGASDEKPLPTGREALSELAMDLRWSWNHCADRLWSMLDPALWTRTAHPSDVLQAVSRERLAAALADPEFAKELERVVLAKRQAESAPAWFQRTHPVTSLTCVAYFCMEFMLTEALPIYSGGLGNVAGDQLKAASDLGVPVVGIGLLYQHGYFRQVIDRNGVQQAIYPYNDPAQMPVTPCLQANGEWLRVSVEMPGGPVWVRAWHVQVGRCQLYLLDSNEAGNTPVQRGITSELYGGDAEVRLKQELLLGIGGWRVLRALGIRPEICHLNEGHSAFLIIERARCFMEESGQPFSVALAATRVGNIFTTHTAVAAGFDHFPPPLIEQYLGTYVEAHPHLSLPDLLALGRLTPGDTTEPFNMAYLAMHGSGSINGVSELHGRVSRRLFAPLFPRWPQDEVPVGHVTNGVHMPTWDSEQADTLWTEACGRDRWKGMSQTLGEKIRLIEPEKLWALRMASRAQLVDYARERLARQLGEAGVDGATIGLVQSRIRPSVLTLGFARRFAAYKRPNLLLHDPARLMRILCNPKRPAQLILAGKAHPADGAGQRLIQEWTRFIWSKEIAPPVIFLADYDMQLAERLVQGVDVWINTPQRPWEACGTSGMKVLVNGGLNLSELDGWWAEAYSPEVGWAIGDGREHGSDPAWDAAEADALYTLLESEVIPEFYERDAKGLPRKWTLRIRESMARLTQKFSSARTVCEYTDQLYIPSATAYLTRAASHGAMAQALVAWHQAWSRTCSSIFFDDVTVDTVGDQHRFRVSLFLGDISPTHVRVELYAMGLAGDEPELRTMARMGPDGGNAGSHSYLGTVPVSRDASDYTARLTAAYPGLLVPLEAKWILWQK